MKISIIGVGKVGRQIAFCSLIFLRPKNLLLYDIKDLSGDVLDLQHAANGLGIKTEICKGTDFNDSDFIIISAGYPRNKKRKNMSTLLMMNKPILRDIFEKLIVPNASENTKIIMVTNPVEELTEWAKRKYPRLKIFNAEHILKRMRDGVECGWNIVKTKGYSDFGPSIAIIKLMEELI